MRRSTSKLALIKARKKGKTASAEGPKETKTKVELDMVEYHKKADSPIQECKNVLWDFKALLASDGTAADRLVVFLGAERSQAACDGIGKVAYLTAQQDWMLENMADENLGFAHGVIANTGALRKVHTCLKSMGTDVAPKTAGPQELKDVFNPKLFCVRPKDSLLESQTEYGMLQVLLTLTGQFTVYGLPLAKVQGASNAAEHTHVSNLEAKAFRDWCYRGGIAYSVRPGLSLIPPPEYIYMYTNVGEDADCHGVGWQLPRSSASTQITRQILEGMLNANPELRAGTHFELNQYLATMVAAA